MSPDAVIPEWEAPNQDFPTTVEPKWEIPDWIPVPSESAPKNTEPESASPWQGITFDGLPWDIPSFDNGYMTRRDFGLPPIDDDESMSDEDFA